MSEALNYAEIALTLIVLAFFLKKTFDFIIKGVSRIVYFVVIPVVVSKTLDVNYFASLSLFLVTKEYLKNVFTSLFNSFKLITPPYKKILSKVVSLLVEINYIVLISFITLNILGYIVQIGTPVDLLKPVGIAFVILFILDKVKNLITKALS